MKIYNTKGVTNFLGKLCYIAEDLKIELDFNRVSGNCYGGKIKSRT